MRVSVHPRGRAGPGSGYLAPPVSRWAAGCGRRGAGRDDHHGGVMKLPASYHFHRLPGEAPVPEAWRMLDHTVARWVTAHGGSSLLATLAGWASHAEGHGDSALPLDGDAAGRNGMAPLDGPALAQILAEPMVAVLDASAGDAPGGPVSTPFVIDDGHFYL